MEQAAQALYNKYETAVLCKGGHSIEDANDYLYGADGGNWLEVISVLTIKIRMEPAVRFPVRLPLIWRRTVN